MTHRWAPSGIQRWLLIAAAALVGCDNDPVERELVGTWQAAIVAATGAVELRFTTLSNGQYRIDQAGVGAQQAETGYFAATDGEWRKENITGGIEQGTYELLSENSVLFQSPTTGAVVWTRVAEAISAPSPEPPAAAQLTTSPQLSTPTLGPAGAITAGAPPLVTQDILATGPFGSPVAPSAPPGFAQPIGVLSTPTAFGAPQYGPPAAPFGAPAAARRRAAGDASACNCAIDPRPDVLTEQLLGTAHTEHDFRRYERRHESRHRRARRPAAANAERLRKRRASNGG